MQRWLTASARSAVRKPPFEYLSIVMPAASRSAILVLIASPLSLICHELIAGMPSLVVRVIAGATMHALKQWGGPSEYGWTCSFEPAGASSRTTNACAAPFDAPPGGS